MVEGGGREAETGGVLQRGREIGVLKDEGLSLMDNKGGIEELGLGFGMGFGLRRTEWWRRREDDDMLWWCDGKKTALSLSLSGEVLGIEESEFEEAYFWAIIGP